MTPGPGPTGGFKSPAGGVTGRQALVAVAVVFLIGILIGVAIGIALAR